MIEVTVGYLILVIALLAIGIAFMYIDIKYDAKPLGLIGLFIILLPVAIILRDIGMFDWLKNAINIIRNSEIWNYRLW